MKVVCLLFRLNRRQMAWFRSCPFNPIFEWLWRSLVRMWCCSIRMIYRGISMTLRLRLRGPEENEGDIESGDELPDSISGEDVYEDEGGQHEVLGDVCGPEEVHVHGGDSYEACEDREGQHGAPGDRGGRYGALGNRGCPHKVRKERGVQYEAPEDEGSQQKALLDQGIQQEAPGERGGQHEAPGERGGQNEVDEKRGSQHGVSEDTEGQHKAPGAKRTAPFEGEEEEGLSKRCRCEEEEEEEDEFDNDDYRVETTDEFYCGYDSTWEMKSSEESTSRTFRTTRNFNFERFERAARDMQNYRHDYDGRVTMKNKGRKGDAMPNLDFYLGNINSKPDDVHIEEFHNKWHSNYDRLEYVHTFIQWLFPLQEPGMNSLAKPMTSEEVQKFRQNEVAKKNLLKSYKLMLDFYGISLRDEKTGEVERAANWMERFDNLNRNTHNNLRITRILKCLGSLGFKHYQAPLVHFFLYETLVEGELPRVKESVLSYFLFAVRDKRERRKLIKFAFINYECNDEFVWCPKKVQMSLQKQIGDNRGACDSGPSGAEEKVTEDSESEFSVDL